MGRVVSTGSTLGQNEYLFEDRQLTNEEIRVILDDDHIKSKREIRESDCLDFPEIWKDEDVKEEISLFCQDWFKKHRKELSDGILNSLYFYNSALEWIWKKEDGKLVFDKFKDHAEDFDYNFAFDSANKLTKADNSEVKTDYKFFIHRHKPSNLLPNGRSIFSKKTYNLVILKENTLEFLHQLLDKFGVPSVAALLEQMDNLNEDQKDEVVDSISVALESMRSGAGAALEGVKDLMVLSASGSASDFETAINICNNEFSKIMIGSGRTTDNQSTGAYSSDKTAENTIYRLRKTDNEMVTPWFNKALRWIVDVYFGVEFTAPIVSYDLAKGFEFDKMLKALEKGATVSKKEFYKHVPEAKCKEDEFSFDLSLLGQSTNFEAPIKKKSTLPKLRVRKI